MPNEGNGKLSARLGGAALVATGSGSTLLSKSLYGVRAPRMADGRLKLFRKPLANTFFMFCGMALILPLIPLVDWIQAKLQQRRERQQRRGGASTVPASDASQMGSASEPLLPPAVLPGGQQQGQRLAAAVWLHQCGLLVLPTLLDVACTATHKIGLMWLAVSVYQMLRGSEIIFTALLTVVLLRRRLTAWHTGGLALVVTGITVVGVAGLLAHPQVAPSDVSRRHAFAGMVITVLSEALHAAQIVVEDHYLSNLHLHPLTVVGMEGVLGVATMLAVVLPLAQHLPGADGKGLHEDSWDSLYMLRHSGQLRAVALSYVAVAGAFNLSGMLMTDSVGAVYRTMLESLRMLSVWVLDLLIYYLIDGEDHRFGEPWTAESWLQAAGFALLVAGTAVYAQANHLHSSGSAAAAMARLRIRRRHPRLDGRAGEFGQWWVTPADKVEVWSYRASLTLVAAAFGAGTAAALAPQDAGWAPALWANGSLLAAAGGVGILGATTLIHIYITPIKRALQALAALGCAGGAWLALQHADVPLPQYVAQHPGSMWLVGPAFAALAGICFKEGFCYEKRESFILSGLIPLLCLLHLTGLMPELADKGFSAVVAGMLLLFAARKYTQPVFADIGDKTIFEWQAMTEEEQRAKLEQIRLEVAAYGEDEEVI